MKCDWKKFEQHEQAAFKCRLSGEPLHFGLIPVWERKKFARFCIEKNLIEKIPGDHPTSYIVRHVFAYKRTWNRTSWRQPIGILLELWADLFNQHTRFIGRETIVVEHRDRDPKYTGYNYVQVRDGWLYGGWIVA